MAASRRLPASSLLQAPQVNPAVLQTPTPDDLSATQAAASAQRLVRTEGRSPEIVAFQVSVISYFVDAAELLGVPKSLAAIYGACFASPKALSFADLGEQLYISTGSISQGLRLLRGVGALKEVSIPGDRVARYEPDIELRKLILHYLEQRVERQLDAGRKRIREIKGSIPPHAPAESKKLAVRIKSLEGWHSKSRAILPLVKGALRLT